jgi:hypothetical protein
VRAETHPFHTEMWKEPTMVERAREPNVVEKKEQEIKHFI